MTPTEDSPVLNPLRLDVPSAARLAGQVQEFGFDSARLVIGRFVEMFERFQSRTGSSGSFGDLPWVLLESTRQRSAGADALLLPDVVPGGRCGAAMWLHNPTRSTVRNLRFWSSGLVAHDGRILPPSAFTFRPPGVTAIGPDSSVAITASVAIPVSAVPGTYHAQVLVDGLPEEAFPARVNVVDASLP